MKTWTFRAAAHAAAALAGWALIQGAVAHAATLLGPISYQSFNNSPFMAMNFSQFQLISMTNLPDGAFSVPGVSASTGTSDVPTVIGPGGSIDSVDGQGNNGHSLFASLAITFTFNPNVLGYLPTVAGIVWTDGDLPIHFTGIDAQGNSIGQVNDATGCGFSCGDGNPANYRFFGVIDPVGISSIEISDFSGTIEVDHLQFGLLATEPVPEPSTFALVLVPAALFLTILARHPSLVKAMDFIERWFGVAPDHGGGVTEMLWLLALAILIGRVGWRRLRAARTREARDDAGNAG